MGVSDIQHWILFGAVAVFLGLLSSVDCIPLNSKAAGWMNTSEEDDDRSYSHVGGGNKFSKPFVSQSPRSNYYTAGKGGKTSNKTLAAILLLTVFGLAATALLVILCSKMTKKEEYDSVKGTVY